MEQAGDFSVAPVAGCYISTLTPCGASTAAARGAESGDSEARFEADTLASGGGLSKPELVHVLVVRVNMFTSKSCMFIRMH